MVYGFGPVFVGAAKNTKGTRVTMVAECKSVTAAAKKRYISQPSLSQIPSKVEQDVGVKLFDRNASPITLTYAGEPIDLMKETFRQV